MKKKVISLLLCTLIAGGSVSLFSVNAAENEQEAHYIRAVENNNLLTYYNENGEEVDVDKLNNDVDVNESSLPSKYDLRDYNRLTSVKNQGSEGLCWDFAATASMESNILTNPELSSKAGDTPYKTLDLSERGNTWYIHTNFDDESSPLYGDYMNDPQKGSGGGSADLVAQGLCAGFDVESAANAFTAKSNEALKQVCLQTIGATDVKIEIYKLNSGFTSPQDGTLLSSFDATFDFTGIHTVECPENIKLSAGDNFSVVVTGKSDMLLNFKVNSEDEVSGRSYYIKDGGSWTDVADKWECGYAVIKAYTSNDGEVRRTELEEL